MTTIKKYIKKDGTPAFMFRKYLGIDPLTGKQRETTRRGFSTMKEAKLALARLEIQFEEEGLKKSPKIQTYQNLFENWFELVYKNKVKESTYWGTRFVFDRHILPAIGSYRIDKISVIDCQKQANHWAETSPKRYKRYINYASMVFDYGCSIGILKENPMKKVILPAINDDFKPNEPENFYDRQQLLDFLNRMKEGFPFIRYTFFSLLAFTGLRKGEALALTWRDIDLKKKTITVTKTQAVGKNGKLLVQTPKTRASNRVISIDDNTVDVLKTWRSVQSKKLEKLGFVSSINQLVFSRIDNNSYMHPRTPLSWLDSFYIHNKDMPRITVHGFRHTHASLLFEAGASMKQVQVRMGHTNIKTTMNIYTHVTKESNEEAALLFSDYITNGKRLGQSLGQTKNPTN